MASCFRQYLLMLAVLLTAIGNMNVLSYCECNASLFMGSCACEHEETAHADVFEHSENLPNSSSIFIGSHHCHHSSVASNDFEQITPTTPAQIVPTPQFTIPADFLPELVVTSSISRLREIHDPPDRPLDLQEGSIGYLRPMLI